MTIAEILKIMPKYSDGSGGSGYNVTVNIPVANRPRYVWGSVLLGSLIENTPELLEREVEELTAGKSIVGGGFDDSLQIWLKP